MQATNGNNLFGLNFFDIGDNNLGVANNVGTGLQGIIAGERQHAGRQSGHHADAAPAPTSGGWVTTTATWL